jgi:hypothetical protein
MSVSGRHRGAAPTDHSLPSTRYSLFSAIRRGSRVGTQGFFCLLSVACCLLSAPTGYADTLELDTGAVLTCIILSETDSEYIVHMQVGRSSIAKETVMSVTKQSQTENDVLRTLWRDEKRRYKRSVVGSPPIVKIEGGKRYIRHEGEWLLYSEYVALRKKTEKKTADFITQKTIEDIQAKEEQLLAHNRERTSELIQQRKARRSLRGNTILEEGAWFSVEAQNFIVFFQSAENIAFADSLAHAAEEHFAQIKAELALDPFFLFDERIEIFAMRTEQQWLTAAQEDAREGNSLSISSHYFKELYLYLAAEEKRISEALAHELARLVLEEFNRSFFSKRHRIPFWLIEGLSGRFGEVPDLKISLHVLTDALYKNYAIRLDQLLVMNAYPANDLDKRLFYTESVLLIDFIFSRYGAEGLQSFIRSMLDLYHDAEYAHGSYNALDPKQARGIIKLAVKTTRFLNHDFSGFSTFEENWLRYIVQKAEREEIT